MAMPRSAPAPSQRWPGQVDFGPTRALTTPSFWTHQTAQALIWQPQNAPTPLTFQPLTDSPSSGIVPYTDLNPVRWQTAPASQDAYHLAWVEADNRLRTALIHADGHTIRGPIELSQHATHEFELVFQANGQATVLWINGSSRQIVTTRLDAEGRPSSIQTLSPGQVTHLAATYDSSNAVHVAWISTENTTARSVHYAILAEDTNQLSGDLVTTLTLPADVVITSFSIGLTATHAIIFIGITQAQTPQIEQVFFASVPFENPQTASLAELQLPADINRQQSQTYSDLPDPRAMPVHTTPRDLAALRWPQTAPGQHTTLPLAVSYQTPHGWRPAVVYFRDGAPFAYQLASNHPADAGPPAITVDAQDNITLTWTGLDGATPHLYAATTLQKNAPFTSDENSPLPPNAALRGLLGGLALGWLWLALPTLLIVFSRPNPWTLPMALALYGAAKLFWPGMMFDAVSLAGLKNWSVRVVILVIGGLASTGLTVASVRRWPLLIQWLIFGTTDMLLTWTLLGGSLL